MRNLVREIHRRSLWQVLGIYLAAAWLVLQVVDLIIDNFGLPEWVAPLALILLLVGLPVVLATAFVNEGMVTGAGSEPPGGSHDARRGTSASERTAPTTADAARPEAGGPAVAGEGRRHWLTWSRALTGGVVAFALLGLLTAGYLVMRSAGLGPAGTLVAKGVLEERSPVLVADFGGDDEELAHAATEALRIDLGQSHVVTVIEPTEVAAALRRMERPADATLDLALAREVAEREGIPAIIAGDIDRAGGGYVLSARLMSPTTGDVLASDRQTARDDAAVLDAIDALSRTIRERIGESLLALGREEPLAAVTTPSLAALRRYSAANRALDLQGDDERAVVLLEEAVALDTAFAMAWRKLGTILNNQFTRRARAVEALERSYRHRDRLTESERYNIEAMYRYQIDTDIPGAIDAYENLLELDPQSVYALNNLGVMYGYMRDHARAQEYYQAAIEVDSMNSLSYTNALQERYARGDTSGAYELLELFDVRFPGHPGGAGRRIMLSAAVGDYDEAERLAREMVTAYAGNPAASNNARRALAATLAVRGRVVEARSVMEETLTQAAASGNVELFLTTSAELADIELGTLGAGRAGQTLDAALARFPIEDLPPLTRPYADLGLVYARAGSPDGARLLAELEANVDRRLLSPVQAEVYDAARAYAAINEGRFEEALEIARLADRGFCTACGAQGVADAFDAAGRADSAIVALRRYVEVPWLFRLVALDRFVLAGNLERLGQLYEEQGDLASAAEFYGRFVALWEEADPPLQPRVEAARSRLEAILAEIG
ncbi:MAG: hypothetical protein R3195_03605 [Gemmatimonadota bacterium]|nr:hypothetical protein [Gemmatimonadota bacterium]